MDTDKREGTQAIAGWLTAEDWRKLRVRLNVSDTSSPWDDAYRDYYRQRLNLRYLEPIKTLQDNGTYQGEGFSIVSIQCALIEFLAATHSGLAYRFLKAGEILGPYEYSMSRQLFIDFLQRVPPFSGVFTTPAIATDFTDRFDAGCYMRQQPRTVGGYMPAVQPPLTPRRRSFSAISSKR